MLMSAGQQNFLTVPGHLATCTTLRRDGSPHTTPVRFTWDRETGLARVMTVVGSRRARNLLACPGSRVSLCQVEGFRWVTLEGSGVVVDDTTRVAEGARHYARRYGMLPPSPPGLVVVEVSADRVTSLNV